ncbi:hypothetical protein [Alcanivorax sp.]|uniref:hypothetical protein n=1 Tax=Alcanivorax sp. TaxID=1872427 RepID=UPI0025C2D0E5|nr:hypothetical protein [Alcanivorax sp.]
MVGNGCNSTYQILLFGHIPNKKTGEYTHSKGNTAPPKNSANQGNSIFIFFLSISKMTGFCHQIQQASAMKFIFSPDLTERAARNSTSRLVFSPDPGSERNRTCL